MSKEKQNELLINDVESNNSEVISNKQIEEMAKLMCEGCADHGDCKYDICDMLLHEANRLYNAGYRKQIEGEWQIKAETYQMIDDYDEELFVECPFCQRRFYVPYEFDDEKIFKYAREHYPYCNCGAKMKGGAE